jgi:hypothetical protein
MVGKCVPEGVQTLWKVWKGGLGRFAEFRILDALRKWHGAVFVVFASLRREFIGGIF